MTTLSNQVTNKARRTAIIETVNIYKKKRYPDYIINAIEQLLILNTTEGGSYEMLSKKFSALISQKESASMLYVKKANILTETVINTFSACYSDAITSDLGLSSWYGYSGSLLTTSRKFCIACVKKGYVHESEFPSLITGDFDEYKELGGKVNPKTGLAQRLDKDTTIDNLTKLRGGIGCGHQMIPVSHVIVPKEIKEKLYATEAYKTWLGYNNSLLRIRYDKKTYFDCNSLDILEIEEGAKVLVKDIFIKLWPLLYLIHKNE